jgi:hypothetical protein
VPRLCGKPFFEQSPAGSEIGGVNDLNKIRTAVWQLLENGREHWIADGDRSYADPFIKDFRTLLARL